MNKDIRLSVSFFYHPKTFKLQSLLGPEGILSLLRLWCYAGQWKPDGDLAGMNDEEIEGAALFVGSHGLFVQTLKDVKFLDRDLKLHDWRTHNPWAAGSADRSDKARFSRMAKTHTKLFNELHEKGITAISITEFDSLTKPQRNVNGTLTEPETPRITPSPAPSPAPSPTSNTTPPAAPAAAVKVKKKSAAEGYVFPGIPDWIGEQEWNEYVLMRKRIGYPLTDWGKHLTVLELDKLRAEGQNPNACLNQSSEKSYRGVFKLSGGSHGTHSGGNQGSGHPKAEPGKYAELRPGERVCTSDEL